MNKRTLQNIVFLLLSMVACTNVTSSEEKEIFFADPTIFVEDNVYYLTGTRNREPLGFAMLVSEDLKTWKSPTEDSLTMILKKGEGSFGSRGFWAPQIFKNGDKYLYTYTANEHTAIASSKHILGPYTQDEVSPIDNSEKNIDSYLFKDDDGKYYLYHVRFNNGNYLWCAEFDMLTKTIKKETLKKCFTNTEAWEATPNYKSLPIMEGPTVLKMKNKYYLFYSANHFMNIDYAVGYATADSPMGPWAKYENNPIIHRHIVGENGSGHGDVFTDLNGQLNYVYHVHYSDEQVTPRRTRIIPLQLNWNQDENIYDIIADSDEIIIPVVN